MVFSSYVCEAGKGGRQDEASALASNIQNNKQEIHYKKYVVLSTSSPILSVLEISYAPPTGTSSTYRTIASIAQMKNNIQHPRLREYRLDKRGVVCEIANLSSLAPQPSGP